MTATRRRVTGIVLAGGRSSRFSGTWTARGSKLDADLGGRSVLDRTIDALSAICSDVLVVGPPSGDDAGDRIGVRYLSDTVAFEGPLAGLAIGLGAARTDIAIVVGGDMPLVRPAVLRLLVDRLVGAAATTAAAIAATILDDGPRVRPLPAALQRDPALVAAREALDADERSLRALLARLDATVIAVGVWRAIDPDGDTLLDVDTPADLELARVRLAARAGRPD